MNINKIPDYIKDAPRSVTDDAATTIMNKLQPSGRQFIYKTGDSEKLMGGEVEIIILAITPPDNYVNHRSYYTDKYSPDASGPPVCASIDGVKPLPYVPEPQSETCSTCPQAVLGSSGFKKAAACGSFKMIYFVFPDNLEEFAQLKVSITALKQLGVYRYAIKQSGGAIAGAVTKVSFDPTELVYGKQHFEFVRWLDQKSFAITTQLAVSPKLEQITGQQQTALPAPAASEPEYVDVDTTDDTDDEDDPLAIMDKLNEKEVSVFDTVVTTMNTCVNKTDLSKYLRSIPGELKQLTQDELTKLKALVDKRIATLSDELTASDPKDLPGVLQVLTAKPNSPEYLDSFIALANKVTGEVFNPEFHMTSEDGFPQLTKGGKFRKKTKAAPVKIETDDDDAIAAIMSELDAAEE